MLPRRVDSGVPRSPSLTRPSPRWAPLALASPPCRQLYLGRYAASLRCRNASLAVTCREGLHLHVVRSRQIHPVLSSSSLAFGGQSKTHSFCLFSSLQSFILYICDQNIPPSPLIASACFSLCPYFRLRLHRFYH